VVATALNAACPTYVDDTAAEIVGPAMASLGQYLLIAAGHAAGLLVLAHSCVRVRLGEDTAAARAFLINFPARFFTRNDQVWVSACPVPLLLEAARRSGASNPTVVHDGCRCGLKTAVVPAHSLDGWKTAMAASPMGAQCVHLSYRYLGVQVAGRSAVHTSLAWSPGSVKEVRVRTWQRPTSRAEDRVATIVRAPASPAVRSSEWNMYVVSLVIYPAQLCAPDTAGSQALLQHVRRVFRTAHWIPAWAIGAFGAYFGVRGAPRCPIMTGRAAAATAHARNAGWAPPPQKGWCSTVAAGSEQCRTPSSPSSRSVESLAP